MRIIYFIICCFAVALSSCTSDTKKNMPDVSGVSVDYDFSRFDQDLLALDTVNMLTAISGLENIYGTFANLYFSRIVPIPGYGQNQDKFVGELKSFIRSGGIQSIQDSVEKVYTPAVIDNIEDGFEEAFKYYKHYFPARSTPDVFTFTSEFGYASFIFQQEDGQDGLGVGLDMFLGPTFPYEALSGSNNAFSSFMTRTYNKEHLVKKTIDAIVDDLIQPPASVKMLDALIYEGKKQYLLEMLMPEVPDSIKWEMTSDQLDWLEQNEWNIWQHIINEDLLYSNSRSEYVRLLRPSPHSVGMPPEAPGRAVIYPAYKIVASFMARNPEISLPELLAIEDGQKILNEARYKPRK